MGCHVANMQTPNLIVPTVSLISISRREGSIQRTLEQARQLSRTCLVAPSVHQGWRMAMGMRGMRKVILAPLAPLHFLWVCYGSFHSVQILCFGFAPVILPAL
jgi:hypothetical protein